MWWWGALVHSTRLNQRLTLRVAYESDVSRPRLSSRSVAVNLTTQQEFLKSSTAACESSLTRGLWCSDVSSSTKHFVQCVSAQLGKKKKGNDNSVLMTPAS